MSKLQFGKLVWIVFFLGGFITLIPNLKQVDTGPKTFEEIHQEVKDFYKKEVGYDVRTPIKDIGEQTWLYRQDLKGVLAYCWIQPGQEYITFNHNLINKYAKDNMDFVFQVILHEYTHL